MALNIANIQNTKYYPELLPDSQILNNGALGELSILDVRRYPPKYIQFGQFSTEDSAVLPSAELRIENDRQRYFIGTDYTFRPEREMQNFNIIATDYIKILYYGRFINNLIYYNLWVYEPSVAHKLLFQKPLTDAEQVLNEQYNVEDEVKKGLLPLKFNYMIDREYQLVDAKRTFTYMDGAFTTTEAVVQSFPARPNEIIVLESLSGGSFTATSPLIKIDRDSQSDYIEIPANALNNNINLPCFIPALKEIKIKVIASGAGTGSLRYVLSRYRLNDILKVRFGLVSRDEVDPELYDKVKAGIL